MGVSVLLDFRPHGADFRSIGSGFRLQESEIRPPETEIRPPIWRNSDSISMTKMQTHNTNFASEVFFLKYCVFLELSQIMSYLANILIPDPLGLLSDSWYCVNLRGFNKPSQKWLNIVYLNEDRPPYKFQSHTTIYDGKNLVFLTFQVRS